MYGLQAVVQSSSAFINLSDEERSKYMNLQCSKELLKVTMSQLLSLWKGQWANEKLKGCVTSYNEMIRR